MKRSIIIGIAVLALGGGIYARYTSSPAEKSDTSAPTKNSRQARPVVLQKARTMMFEERLVLSGNVLARNTAMVSPRVEGVLDTIMVDEGDIVVANETKLFQTDAGNLAKAVEIARQQHEVARCTVLQRRAEQERVAAEHKKAGLDYARYKKLFADNVISKSEYENQETAFQSLEALLKQSRVSILLAEEQQKQAALNLGIAEKNLHDSLVLAPINGVVSTRYKEPGEMGQKGSPVLEIQDLTDLEVSVFLPEEYFARIIPGKTHVRLRAGNIVLGEQTVGYKSPCVRSDLRTFEVKATLAQVPDGIAPGRIATVEVILQTAEGIGIQRDAVVKRGNGKILFLHDNDSAHALSVRTGLETNGFVQILDDAIAPGTSVIVQGQDFVDDGDAVLVTGEAKDVSL